jgi:hypothetical protein
MTGAGKSKADAGLGNFKIVKKSDDPDSVTRISLGGKIGVGYYCVYRGTKERVIEILIGALASLSASEEEPSISPDDGHRFA